MSFSSGAKSFLKPSKLFVKIKRRILMGMAQNCKSSVSGGEVSTGLRLKKAKEDRNGPCSVIKLERRILLLFVAGLVLLSSIYFLWSSSDSCWTTEAKPLNSFGRKTEALLQHYNVSKNHLLVLSSLFAKSDQMVSVECSKGSRSDMQIKNGISCDLKLLSSEEVQVQQHRSIEEQQVESNDQCPVHYEKIPNYFDQSFSQDKSALALHSLILSKPTNSIHPFGKILQTRGLPSCAKVRESLSTLIKLSLWVILGVFVYGMSPCLAFKLWWIQNKLVEKNIQQQPVANQLISEQKQQKVLPQQKQQQQAKNPPKGAGKWRKKLLLLFILLGVIASIWLFWDLNSKINSRREETLANMCDERARMLQDQFNVSMNHVHALAILVSTFHHGEHPSAMNQF